MMLNVLVDLDEYLDYMCEYDRSLAKTLYQCVNPMTRNIEQC